ncbi:MAG: site-specific DNA-methyltransferase [Candidatus Acidiferrales bacterium]
MSTVKRKTVPVARTSAALAEDQLARLKEIFPECFTEGRVDFDKLRETLGEEIDSRPERYSFTWAGKRDAIRLLQTPSRATLIPCPKESINFEESGNLFIEGDNLEVLKLLYKSYFGRVKMIYIDPPYNTGNDFVYPDNFADPLDTYLRLTRQKESNGNLLTSNPETSGRYHSAWLSMMYPRLFLARQLLSDDGVMFISVDDHEIYNLRLLMNEVFGEENFIAQITVLSNPKGRVLGEHFARSHDYLLVVTRSALESELSLPKTSDEVEQSYPESDERGRYRLLELRNTHRQFGRFNRPKLYFPLYVNPTDEAVSLSENRGWTEVLPNWDDGFEGCWSWGVKKATLQRNALIGKKVSGRWKIFRKAYALGEDGDVVRKKLKTIWNDKEYHTEKGQAALDDLVPGRVFQSPKPVGLIQTQLELCNDPDAIVLDFFAGSATTAQAVLDLNRADGGDRRFICVQLPEPTPTGSEAKKKGFKTIAEIGEERIRRVIKKLNKEREGKLALGAQEEPEDLGFQLLKLSESNYKPWTGVEEKDSDSYGKTMELYTDPLVVGWKPENVIVEVILKEGFDLNSRIEKLPGIKGNTVYHVSDPERGQNFRICLDDALKPATIKVLSLSKDDLFICRDKALDDGTAANLALQCRLKTI